MYTVCILYVQCTLRLELLWSGMAACCVSVIDIKCTEWMNLEFSHLWVKLDVGLESKVGLQYNR